MPKRNILIFLFCFFLSACVYSNDNENSFSIEELNQNILFALKDPRDMNQLYGYISPDGNWLVDIYGMWNFYSRQFIFKMTSIKNPEQEISKNTNITGYCSHGLWWSSDSNTVILGISTEELCPKRYTQWLVFLNINEQKLIEETIVEPYKEGDYYKILWSPDNTKVAVISLKRDLFIYDRYGKLLNKREIPFPEGTYNFIDWLWGDEYIYYMLYGPPNESSQSILFRINPEELSEMELLLKFPGYITIGGINPQNTKIIIVTEDDKGNEVLDLYNTSTWKLIESIPLGNELDMISEQTSGSRRYIALDISEKIWIYDWKKGDLELHEEVSQLIGWKSGLNGFLVLKKIDDNFVFDLIKP